jgi:hypothetical protein
MSVRPALVRGLAVALLSLLGAPAPSVALAWDWFPTEEETENFRRSWNPQTHGPLLISPADTQRKGQWLFWAFAYGEVASRRFDGTYGLTGSGTPFSQDAAMPGAVLYYGLTDHVSLGVSGGVISYRSDQLNGGAKAGATGPDDIGLIMKARHIVQDPDGWRPSVGTYTRISLPVSRWAGVPEIPGGFVPITPRPATRAGALSITEGPLVRKNLEPFRLSGMALYTYNTPGTEQGQTVYASDLLDMRLSLEYVVPASKGFGLILDWVIQQGLPWRLDGHAITTGYKTFALYGAAVGAEYRFTQDIVASCGVLFTLAGQNNVDAVYPGASIKYYWGRD